MQVVYYIVFTLSSPTTEVFFLRIPTDLYILKINSGMWILLVGRVSA